MSPQGDVLARLQALQDEIKAQKTTEPSRQQTVVVDAPEPSYVEGVQSRVARGAQDFVERSAGDLLGLAALSARKAGAEKVAQFFERGREGVSEGMESVWSDQRAKVDAFQSMNGNALTRFFEQTLPGAVGGTIPLILGGKGLGSLGRAAGLGEKGLLGATKLGVGATGAAQGGVQQYYEARAAGADESTATKAFFFGAAGGASEGYLGFGRRISELDQYVGGAIGKTLVRMALDSGEEFAQNKVQRIWNDLSAQGLYDPQREVFLGLDDEDAAAAVLGLLGGGAAAVGARVAGPTPEVGAPTQNVAPTLGPSGNAPVGTIPPETPPDQGLPQPTPAPQAAAVAPPGTPPAAPAVTTEAEPGGATREVGGAGVIAQVPTEAGLFGVQERPPAPRAEGAPVRVTQPNLIDMQPGDQRGQQTIEDMTQAEPAPAKKPKAKGKKYPSGSVGEPRTVADFVVESGGIDLRKGFEDQLGQKGGEYGDLWERLRKKEAGRQIPGLIYGPESKSKGKGLTPDEMTEALYQAGFTSPDDGGRPSLNDLIDWLDSEVQSDQPHYAPGRAPEVAPPIDEAEWNKIGGNLDVLVAAGGGHPEGTEFELFAFPPPLFQGMDKPRSRYQQAQGAREFVGPETAMDAVRRRAQDKFLRVQRAKEASKKVTEESDAPGQIEVFEGKIEEHIRKGEDRFIEPIKRLASSIGAPIFMDRDADPAGSPRPSVDLYLLARSAPRRNEVVAARTKGENVAGSGLSTALARDIVKQAEGGPHGAVYRDIGERYDSFNKLTRKLGRRLGLTSQETIEAWEQTMGPHYAPARTDMDSEQTRPGGRGFGVPRKPLSKRAEGRTSLPDSPLVFSLIQYNQAAALGEKNAVSESLAKLIEANAAPGYWRVRKQDAKLEDGAFDAKPEHTIPFKRNGEVFLIETTDPLLARAMLNLGADQSGKFLQFVAGITRYLAAVRTSYSPEFIVRNLTKDMQTAFVHMAGEKGYGMAARTITKVPKAIQAVHSVLKNPEAPGRLQDKFRRMREAGGTVGWFHTPNYAEYAERIQKDLEALAKGPASSRSIVGALRAAGEWIEIKNRSVENGVRLAAFDEATEGGASDFAAARLSKNLTVNFNRKGEWGTTIGAFWMFFNASVQSTTRQIEALVKSPRVRKIAFAVAASGATESILNRWAAGVGDDGEDEYDKIGEFIKRGNWIIAAPKDSYLEDVAQSLPKFFQIETEDGGWFLRIPMPYGYGLFHDLGRQTMDVALGEREPGEAAASFTAGAWDTLFPFGSSAPTVVEPAVEIRMNRQHGDRPIHPDHQFGPPSSDAAKAFSNASRYSKSLAKWLNEITGGDEVEGGAVDVHPDTLDYLASYATGGAGKFVLDSKKLIDAATGQGEAKAHDIPFWRVFVGAPWDGWTKDRFYQNVEAYETARERHKKGLELEAGDLALLQLRGADGKPMIQAAQARARELGRVDTPEADAALNVLMEHVNRTVINLREAAKKKP